MSTINAKKSNISKYIKGTGGILKDVVGEYFQTVMPNSSDIFSDAKKEASKAVSALANTPQKVSSSVKELRSQYTLRNISGWFKSSYDELEMESGDSEAENLSYDTPDSDDNGSTFREMPAAEKSANKIAKSVIGVGSQLAESQMQLTANITSSLKDQTKIIKKGFEKVDKTLQSILEVVTKNTATMIEVTAASASDRSSSESMIERNKFNLGDYKKILQENISNSPLSMLQMPLMQMKGAMADPKSFFSAKNLLSMGLNFGMDKLAPGLEKSMKEFDKSLNDMIMSSLIRLGQDKSFGFKGILSRIVGINSERNDFNENTRSSLSIKAVPFDSLAHEAITNAIPGYLRKILVALGGEDTIYDYRSRSFRSKGAMQREFRNRSAANGSIGHASKDMKDIFGTDDFGNMMYDLMVSRLGSESDMNSIIDSFKDEGQLKKFLTDTLSMKDENGNQQIHLSSKERKRIDQMEKRYRQALKSSKGKSIGKNINMSVARSNVNRNRDMQSYIEEMDRYGIDVSEFSADAQTDIKAILERNGRLTDAEKKAGRSVIKSGNRSAPTDSDALEGLDYSNRALYEIWRRLNEGINVFQVGSSNGTEPFQKFSSEYLKPPKNYHAKNISGSDFVASSNNKMIKEMLSDHGPNLLENQEGENLDEGTRVERWIGSRGKRFGKALMSGDAQGIVGAGAGALKDVGGVISKAINKSFGNITGAIRHKFTGAAYSYQDTDKDGKPIMVHVAANEKKGILGFIAGEFNNSLKNIKEKGSNWFKSVSGYFKFDDGKADKEDGGKAANRRNKFIAASVGALAGGGLLGGPIGMLMGGLAGSMISGFDVGGKIKDLLFGRDKDGKGTGILARLSDKVIDPIKYQFQKTAHALGNMVKKNILGPLSDLGQAIKDKITAAAESRFGKVFKFIGKALMAPFKGIGKLLLNIVKLPVNLIGGATRMVAGAGTKLFGGVTEGLAKTIAGKSTVKHTITDPETGETKELSSKDYIKYRRKERNKKIKEEDAGFDNFKTWQRKQREARAERRKRYKDATSEDIMIENIDVSKETSENTSAIAENTSNIAESVDTLTRNATEHNGQESIATHDQGIHDLLKEIIKLLTGENDGSAMSTVEHVDDLHEEIPVEKLPDSVGEAKSIIANINKGKTGEAVGKLTENTAETSKKSISTIEGNNENEENAVNTNSDDQAREAANNKDFASASLGAISNLAGANGDISNNDASDVTKAAEEAASSNPNPGKIKSVFNKLLHRKEDGGKQEGEKKQSFLSKLLGGIGNVVGGVFGNVKHTFTELFSGNFGPLLTNIAGIGLILGGVGWLKKKGNGSILEGVSVVAGEVKDWWGEHKEDIGKAFKNIGTFFADSWNNLIKPLWTDVIKPILPALLDLLKGLSKATGAILKHFGLGLSGEEDPTTAGVNMALARADVETDKASAIVGDPTAHMYHLERDGSGDKIINQNAENTKNDIFQRSFIDVTGQKGLAATRENFWTNNSNRHLDKAVAAEATGNTAKAERELAKATKSEDKAKAAASQGNSYSYSGAAARNLAKIGVTNAIGSGLGAVTTGIATSLGVDEDQAKVIGNATSMAAGYGMTISTVNATLKGKKSIIDKIVDGFEKLINAIAKKFKGKDAFKGIKFTDAMFKKCDDFFAKMITKIPGMKKLMEAQGPKWLQTLAAKLGIQSVAGASAAVTLGITVAAGAINGLLNGICGVEHLFGVLPDKATSLMVTISAGLKTILGALETLPVVGAIVTVLDMLDTIIAGIFGKGLTQLLAEFLINLTPDAVAYQEARKEFESELAYYNETYGTNLNTNTFNDKVNRGGWMDMLWQGKQDYDENGHLRFDEAGGDIHHGMEQLFVGGERQYYKDENGQIRKDEKTGEAIQLQDEYGNAVKKDMKWGDYVGNWFGSVGRFFGGGDKYETDENGYAKLDENGNKIVAEHEKGFFENWNEFWQGIGANISQFIRKIPEAFGKIGNSFSTMAGMIGNGDVGALWSASSSGEDDEMSGFTNIFDTISKVIFTIPTAVVGVGKGIWNFFVNVGSNISQAVTGMGQNIKAIWGSVKDGNIQNLWNLGNETDTGNMFYGFTSALTTGAKVIASIPTAIVGVGKTVFDFFKNVGSSIAGAFRGMFDNIVRMATNIPSGDLEALWSGEDSTDSNNMLSGFTGALNTVGKVVFTIPTAIFWVGNKIKDFFVGIGTAVANGFTIIMDNAETIRNKAFEGDISGLWELPYEEDENNPIGGVMQAIFIIQKVIHTPMAAIFWVGHMIGGFFKSIGESIANDNRKYQFAINSIEAAAEEGDVGAVWSVPYTAGTSFVSPFFFIGVIISKIFNTVKAVLNGVFGSILGFFGIKVDKSDVDKTSVGNRDKYAIDSNGNVVETEKGTDKIINIVYTAGSDEANAARDSGNFRVISKSASTSTDGTGGGDSSIGLINTSNNKRMGGSDDIYVLTDVNGDIIKDSNGNPYIKGSAEEKAYREMRIDRQFMYTSMNKPSTSSTTSSSSSSTSTPSTSTVSGSKIHVLVSPSGTIVTDPKTGDPIIKGSAEEAAFYTRRPDQKGLMTYKEIDKPSSSSTSSSTSSTTTTSSSSSSTTSTTSTSTISTSKPTEGGNPLNKRVTFTSAYGYRDDPVTGAPNSFHRGVDLIPADGSKDAQVGARYAGRVTKVVDNVPDSAHAIEDANGNLSYPFSYSDTGNAVWVETPSGKQIVYMHLKSGSIPKNITENSIVNVGDKIGMMGTTGYSTGEHLHYEIHDPNAPEDPRGTHTYDPWPEVSGSGTLSGFTDHGAGTRDKAKDSGWLSSLITGIKNAGIKALNVLTGGLFGNTDEDEENVDKSYITSVGNLTGINGEETAAIWNYLKTQGWTDEAISGLLGCWSAESGVTARRMEYDYISPSNYPDFIANVSTNGKFPYEALINDRNLMNQWMEYISDGYATSNPPVKINKDAYLGSDNNYYPGMGYAQWTGPLGEELIKFAQEKNMAWDDPALQLEFMQTQIDKNPKHYKPESWMNATTPEDAADAFARNFEGAQIEDQITARKKRARDIYSYYAGRGIIDDVDATIGMAKIKLEDMDEWDKDYNKYLNESIYPKMINAGLINSDDIEENANTEYFQKTLNGYIEHYAPDGYAKWKGAQEFNKQSSKDVTNNGTLSMSAFEHKYDEYINNYVEAARNQGLRTGGADDASTNLDSLTTSMSKISEKAFSERAGGPRDKIVDADPGSFLRDKYQKTSRRSLHNVGKRAGGGDSSLMNNAFSSARNTAKQQTHQTSSASIKYGMGGAEITYNTNNTQNNAIDSAKFDRMVALMGSMLNELRSIAGYTSSSSGYLESINSKDFVDQGLRDSINSLGKVTKKTSSAKTSGGSARTVASLARPQ